MLLQHVATCRIWMTLLMVILISGTSMFGAPTTNAASTPPIAEPFRAYYHEHQGIRVLGKPLTGLVEVDGYPAQYFEKGRIEDHRREASDPNWAFMYGRLTAELIEQMPEQSVNATSTTYSDLKSAADPRYRQAPPPNFTGGTIPVRNGVFVPYDAQLQPAPGYVVPLYFWSYINQPSLFPGGWLHDIGLPMTEAFLVETVKQGEQRQIMTQAFERTILTYDPKNPPEWQVERGNIGIDLVGAPQPTSAIELPTSNALVTLPLHVFARARQPGEEVRVTLRWQDGTVLTRTFTVQQGEDGTGLLIVNLGWHRETRPPQPAARDATLEIHALSGVLLAQQPVQVLRWDDPAAQPVTLYWLLDERMQPAQRSVPQTIRIGTAVLEELLWGPHPNNLAGFITAIPEPPEVLSYPGRDAQWGARVRLLKLTIQDGVATAHFSRELLAYGGDPQRAKHIRAQITQTLKQFSGVRQVRITIDGQSGEL